MLTKSQKKNSRKRKAKKANDSLKKESINNALISENDVESEVLAEKN